MEIFEALRERMQPGRSPVNVRPRCALTVLFALVSAPAFSQSESLEDETIHRLQEYLRIDTTNPPGNETRAVEFFAKLLEAEGIPYETAESAPGRGNLWARLEGGDEPALVLLNHTDVVPADQSHWSVDPFDAEIRNGVLYGRGALDMKSTGMLQFQAFVTLHRAGKPLRRDVLFVATADEEAGGSLGAGWLVGNRPEIFDNVGFLLNEGGNGSRDGDALVFGVEVTQKVPLWLRLVASDEPSHGSTPRASSSVRRLLVALSKIDAHEFEPRIVPAVATYFRGLAETESEPKRGQFLNLDQSVRNPDFLRQLQLESPFLHALTRNTCAITRLEGSNKINVVPPEAAAEIDCRLLPDQDKEEFITELESIVSDPRIAIEVMMAFTPAVSSTETDLYRAIETVCNEHFPNAQIIPMVSSGFTDSHFFRDLGIVSYGFDPTIVPTEIEGTIHGNDERIPVEAVRQGVQRFLEILERFVY
jgi:acetylornithine deacetylase/succinyl-diaminopimelate desuccinylase-like protein